MYEEIPMVMRIIYMPVYSSSEHKSQSKHENVISLYLQAMMP